MAIGDDHEVVRYVDLDGRARRQCVGGDLAEDGCQGGQFIGSGQDRVLSLARELGIQTAHVHCTGRKLLSLGGRRPTYRGLIPKVGLVATLETAWTIRRFDRLAAEVPTDRPWDAPRAAVGPHHP